MSTDVLPRPLKQSFTKEHWRTVAKDRIVRDRLLQDIVDLELLPREPMAVLAVAVVRQVVPEKLLVMRVSELGKDYERLRDEAFKSARKRVRLIDAIWALNACSRCHVDEELMPHDGKIVAIYGQRVIRSGFDYRALQKQAADECGVPESSIVMDDWRD